MGDSAKKREPSSAAGLFSHSLDGNLSLGNVPTIFSPVPLPVAAVSQKPSGEHQETLLSPFLSGSRQMSHSEHERQALVSPLSIPPPLLETSTPPPGLQVSAFSISSQHNTLPPSGLGLSTPPLGLQLSASPSKPQASPPYSGLQALTPLSGLQTSASPLGLQGVKSGLQETPAEHTSGTALGSSVYTNQFLPNVRPSQAASPLSSLPYKVFPPTTVPPDSLNKPSHPYYVKQPNTSAKSLFNDGVQLNEGNPFGNQNHLNISAGQSVESAGSVYFTPVIPHWFYFNKSWIPFSYYDSRNLEEAFVQRLSNKIVTTDGGRFDVDLSTLQRKAVYWCEAHCEVRRCTWFYKEESLFIPYSSPISNTLELEYAKMMHSGIYNIRVDIAPNTFVIFHNPNVLVQYVSNVEHVDWTGADAKTRPKVIQRGLGELQELIQQGERKEIDHLVFVVHGIGPVADLKMRSIVECVEDFRKISLDLTYTHGFTVDEKPASRVEFIPVQWHSCLRDDLHGVDSQLKMLSLPSISKLRNFTNETLTDILFYTSPLYCQTICDTIVNEMNRMYALFLSRTPSFKGKVCVVGHSLGSCILFDILANQNFDPLAVNHEYPSKDFEDSELKFDVQPSLTNTTLPSISQNAVEKLPSVNGILMQLNLLHLESMFAEEQMDTETLLLCSETDLKDLGVQFGPRKKIMSFLKDFAQSRKESCNVKPTGSIQMLSCGTQTHVNVDESFNKESVQMPYKKGTAGTGQPLVKYSKLDFLTDTLFALGSPLGLFLTCRGVTTIGQNFKLPNCNHFLNIFHPFDPVVYRLEPLINEQIDIPPVLIPHHKGRKRIHLEIKENLSRVGANLKTGLIDAVSRTWSSIHDFARAHTSQQQQTVSQSETSNIVQESHDVELLKRENDVELLKREKMLNFGLINGGKRVDYVLQERPLEMLNEYLFALSSHTCYWTSEDTALLLLKNIYSK